VIAAALSAELIASKPCGICFSPRYHESFADRAARLRHGAGGLVRGSMCWACEVQRSVCESESLPRRV
jgi:hypothetical protein